MCRPQRPPPPKRRVCRCSAPRRRRIPPPRAARRGRRRARRCLPSRRGGTRRWTARTAAGRARYRNRFQTVVVQAYAPPTMKHYTLLYAAPPARHACFAVNVFLFIFQKKGRGEVGTGCLLCCKRFSFFRKERSGEVGASCLLCCKRFYSFFQKKRSGGDAADSRTIIFLFL